MEDRTPNLEVKSLAPEAEATVALEGIQAAAYPEARLQEMVTWSRQDAVREAARRSAALTSPASRRYSPFV